jgi:hypothetical protein
MICARLVIPTAVISGRSFQENFLYLSTKGITRSAKINRPGHATPVTNLSNCVRRNAYSPVKYHSGTVIPGGTLGSNFRPMSTGNTPPVSMMAPVTAITIGTSKTRNLGKWTTIRPSRAIGRKKTWNA